MNSKLKVIKQLHFKHISILLYSHLMQDQEGSTPQIKYIFPRLHKIIEASAQGYRHFQRELFRTEGNHYGSLYKSGSKKPSLFKGEKVSQRKGNSQTKNQSGSQWAFQTEWIGCMYPLDNGQIVPLQIQMCVSRQSDPLTTLQNYLDQSLRTGKVPKNKSIVQQLQKKQADKQGYGAVSQEGILSMIQNLLSHVLGGTNKDTPKPRGQQANANQRQQQRREVDQLFPEIHVPIKKRVCENRIVSVEKLDDSLIVHHTHFDPFEITRSKAEPDSAPTIEEDTHLKMTFDNIKKSFKPLLLM